MKCEPSLNSSWLRYRADCEKGGSTEITSEGSCKECKRCSTGYYTKNCSVNDPMGNNSGYCTKCENKPANSIYIGAGKVDTGNESLEDENSKKCPWICDLGYSDTRSPKIEI